jgi:nucleoside-diphosphate kinase
MSQPNERSLVILKPDAVLRRQIGVNMLKALKKLPDVSVLVFKETTLPEDFVKQLYAEHEGQLFFPALIDMMTSSIGVIVVVVEGPGIVGSIRELLGPRFVEDARAIKGSLRAKYGIVKGVNVAYASSSVENGEWDVELFTRFYNIDIAQDSEALDALNEYIASWDGKFPDNTKSIQKEVIDVLDALADVKAVLQTESNESEDKIRAMLKIILNALLD